MIDPTWDAEAAVALVRANYLGARLRSTVIPSLLRADAAEALRRALAADGMDRFDFAPQGRYAHNDRFAAADLVERLRGLAARIAGAPLALGRVRWLRFAHGDYALLWGDHATRRPEPHLELTLDFSSRATNEAEIVYTRGAEAAFVVPQWPGCLALVERPPDLLRYERYLTHRVGEAEVYRLRIELLPPG